MSLVSNAYYKVFKQFKSEDLTYFFAQSCVFTHVQQVINTDLSVYVPEVVPQQVPSNVIEPPQPLKKEVKKIQPKKEQPKKQKIVPTPTPKKSTNIFDVLN
jgi:hypothetical protein